MQSFDQTLTPDLMIHAYAAGIFPMAKARDDPHLLWLDPPMRGILPLDRFHISRSLARRIRRGGYGVRLNMAFSAVVDHCANRTETWINAALRDVYLALHNQGYAHSFEVWDDDQGLVGGVFGIALGGAFFGESMFSLQTDGSKLALAHLTHHLLSCGFTLFDTQVITDHLARLGAIEISRTTYRQALASALILSANITAQSAQL